MELKIEPHDSDLLRTPAEAFDFSNPSFEPQQFALDLARTMIDYGGIGLSAPQVGVGYRVFSLRGIPNYVFYNPKVVDLDGGTLQAIEGCVTFPGIGVSVERHRRVRLRYTLPNGHTEARTFDGLSARVIQHELDHLDGVLMFARATRLNREFAIKKWTKRVRDGRYVPRKLDAIERAEHAAVDGKLAVAAEQIAERATVKS